MIDIRVLTEKAGSGRLDTLVEDPDFGGEGSSEARHQRKMFLFITTSRHIRSW
jgi:hypothetical protein